MEEPASRQFYHIPEAAEYLSRSVPESYKSLLPHDRSASVSDIDISISTHKEDKKKKKGSINRRHEEDFLSYIACNVIGSDKTFSGPYGLRTAIYLDFTASGRSLQFIEDYIQHEVLPEYGNTHTTTSITSLQTTLYRHEARDVVRNSCNASEHDSVIFVGSGTTGAVHKLIHSLNLSESPIVFVGPHEHHSNILPWVEMGAEVIRISSTISGGVDIEQLEDCLRIFKPFGRQIIGAFSAASNVTGVLADVNTITITLHKHGALAFWDYAAAAPYVKVDMNPYVGGDHQELVYKDAVYFSVHKFLGGVGAPGVLIMKKKLFKNPVPHGCGGGTVFFVRRDHRRYLMEPEMKEEGGTPDIVGSIRAGLVFQLRDAIGTDLIARQDASMLSRAIKSWQDCPNLVLLGPNPETTERLPIISFMIYHPATGLFLHHNFVAAVLNDIFGIQARGGCACAGPYAMDILGMSESVSKNMEELLAEDSRLDRVHLRRIGEYSHREILRPGFVRINLPYFLDADGLDFVIEAIKLVSQHAWKILPQYLFNPETGEWRNKNFQTFKDRKWLGHISYSSGCMSYHQPAQVIKGPLPTNHQDCLNKAREIFTQAEKISIKLPDQTVMFDDQAKLYRWFLLPSEANVCLQNKWRDNPLPPSKLPFCPPSLLEQVGHAVPKMESMTSQIKIAEALERVKEDNGRKAFKSASQDMYSGVSSENVSNSSNCDKLSTSKSFGEGRKQTFERIESAQSQIKPIATGFLDALDKGFVLNNDERSGVQESCDSLSVNSDGDFLKKNQEGIDVSNLSEMISNSLSISSSHTVSVGAKSENIFQEFKPINSLSPIGSNEKGSSVNLQTCDVKSSNSHIVDDVNHDENIHDNKDIKMGDEVNGRELRKEKVVTKGDKGNGWFAPPKGIFKPAVQALEEYKMLQNGDHVLVCLSGGKDSLSLLHTIRQYQFYAKKKGVNFSFGAVTVDPQTPSYDPSPLKKYLSHLGVPYFYESQCIMETASNLPYECASICSFCSRMKRGRIYAAARREGYNVLALGQHLDDLAESFLMSFLHNGSLNTMKAHYTVKEGDLRVIRPFVYVRETELRSFAEQNKLPVISENCPACFEAPKERHRTKQLLAAQEVIFPQVYSSIMSALRPLMARGRQSDRVTTNIAGDKSDKDDDDDDMDL